MNAMQRRYDADQQAMIFTRRSNAITKDKGIVGPQAIYFA